MTGGKRTYKELIAEVDRLKKRNKELSDAMAIADQSMVGYSVDRWVSVPLVQEQLDAVRDKAIAIIALQPPPSPAPQQQQLLRLDLTWRTNILAEYEALLIRYDYGQEGMTNLRVWGLLPV